MRNKKGQIGKIITTFPVMILIFIIMAILIFLSFTFSVWKSPASFDKAEFSVEETNVLLLSKDTNSVKTYVYEVIVKYAEDDYGGKSDDARDFKKKVIGDFLKSFRKEDKCLLLSVRESGVDPKNFAYRGISKNIFKDTRFNLGVSAFFEDTRSSLGHVNSFVVDRGGEQRIVEVRSYFGKCVGVAGD